jgi:hypothetical protein
MDVGAFSQGRGMGSKPGKVRPWTAEEEVRLRELAGRVPVAEIARGLGRTEKAVGWRASALGLSLQVRRE